MNTTAKTREPARSRSEQSETIRMRPDLIITSVEFHGQSGFVVKDPIALTYHQLRSDELFVLRQLDGGRSLETIRDNYNRRFAPTQVTLGELQSLLYRFHNGGLVISDGPNQSHQLLTRQRRRELMKQTSSLASVLFIRFPGWDPDPFLRRVYPFISWLFHPLSIATCQGVCLAAGLWILVNFGEFLARLPAAAELFGADTIFTWMLVIGITKVFHELGHGFACKHFGGECHEIGPMLLVFTPALYCDTTDSWMVANRWHRAAVGLAGMYVEVVLASVCVFLWWNTQPGVLNSICLQVMVVSSVSTVVFNGNPLLRYDGYYVLSDLMGEPNLGEVSQRAWWDRVKVWCLGFPADQLDPIPFRRLARLISYAILSWCYRWFVLLSILWFLTTWLEPHGLASIGIVMAGMSILGMAIGPMMNITRWLENPHERQQVRWPRAFLTTALAAALFAVIALVPVRHRVRGVGQLRPTFAEAVYVSVSGRADRIAFRPGDRVRQGDVLASLANDTIRSELQRASAARDQQAARVEIMRALQSYDEESAAELPTALAILSDLEDQVARREKRVASLAIEAPEDGVIQPAEEKRDSPSHGQLPQWRGQVWMEENLGCFLEAGTQLCWVVPRESWELQLEVAVSDLPKLSEGIAAKVQLDALPHLIWDGTVTKVARQSRQEENPGEDAGENFDPTQGSSPESAVPLNNYLVTIALDTNDASLHLYPGMQGRAAVLVADETLWTTARRWFSNVIRFH